MYFLTCSNSRQKNTGRKEEGKEGGEAGKRKERLLKQIGEIASSLCVLDHVCMFVYKGQYIKK